MHEMHTMASTYTYTVNNTSTAGFTSIYLTSLPAFPRYGLDRCELQDLDHYSIAAMVSMGEEEIEESDCKTTSQYKSSGTTTWPQQLHSCLVDS